jgi:hypothetical protein
LRNASLSTVDIEFAAGVKKVKIDCPLRKADDQPYFPAGFARRYPFQALQLAPGKTWMCHEKRSPEDANAKALV